MKKFIERIYDNMYIAMEERKPIKVQNSKLHELYDWTEGIHKKVLFQVLRKYGPDKLQL